MNPLFDIPGVNADSPLGPGKRDPYIAHVIQFVSQHRDYDHVIATNSIGAADVVRHYLTGEKYRQVGGVVHSDAPQRIAEFNDGAKWLIVPAAYVLTGIRLETHERKIAMSATFDMGESEATQFVGRVSLYHHKPKDVKYWLRVKPPVETGLVQAINMNTSSGVDPASLPIEVRQEIEQRIHDALFPRDDRG
jgi:hypothetical protein